MIIDIAGLLAAAVLLVTLIAFEVRRAGSDTAQPTRPKFLGRTVSRSAVAAIWIVYLLLFLPRVLGLLA
ncbi:hypothetical protein [Arthrobacter celericrescens]|uniref:hypothetical protein n=1 Tax=Arthrobacter celericrescens TaxID=2320851 RepID=UPI000EA1FB00|nr:hypothetical protein [Arthrobacter celericrescens]